MCFGARLAWGMRDGKWLMMLFARLGSLNVIVLNLGTSELEMVLDIYTNAVITTLPNHFKAIKTEIWVVVAV